MSGQNLRKAVRIINELHFHRTEPKAQKVIEVANISITGVGLQRGKESWPEVDQVMKGRFEFRGQFYEAQLRIVHLGEKIVGCQFEGNVQSVQDLFRLNFRQEVSAAKMNQVRTDLLTVPTDGEPRLFVGADESELFYVRGEKGVVRFVLKFLGRILEGKASGAIDFHHNKTHRDDAIRFLQNIQNLNADDRIEISEWILRGSR